MGKKVKMVLYGAPGVGKSTFVSKAPNPLYLCTDGNFEWLDLPEKNHIDLKSWAHAKSVFNDIKDGKYDDYDTIVLDLVEDGYTWCESEFCKGHKLEHIGDYKSFGAGYSLCRSDYFEEISKLLAVNKHVILLSHEIIKVEKDRKGTEHHKYYPSDKMSIEKLWTSIEGRVRYFLRAYMVPEEVDGKVYKKRYLSIIPKENEFGICRGIDENSVQEDIPLDWNVFAETIGLDDCVSEPVVPKVAPKTKKVEPKVEKPKVVEEPESNDDIAPFDVPTETKVEEPKVEKIKVEEPKMEEPKMEEPKVETTTGPIEINDDFIVKCIKEELRIKDIETKYNVKFTSQDKKKYIEIKSKMI